MTNRIQPDQRYPLYYPSYEHDACGVGLVADIKGRPSRGIVDMALRGLVNLTHRGAVGADARTGDGAGVMLQIPHALYAGELAAAGHTGLAAGDYGVATLFLPADAEALATAKATISSVASARNMRELLWRDVPVDPSCLGESARDTLPAIVQLFVAKPEGLSAHEFERSLMLWHRRVEEALRADGLTDDEFFVVSCSSRTVTYKGFCLPEDLERLYPDLANPATESAIALFHQRFSTNTQPTWGLAQPFRLIAHNGEINTVQGNRIWMKARASSLRMMDGDDVVTLDPPVAMSGSDSLSLDTAIEMLRHNGRSLPHALMMAIPEPWEQQEDMDAELRAFYTYHAGMMEQWDGPAALGFSDGVLCGASLDRNGLRPMRFSITDDDLFVIGSEAGTIELDPATVVEKGRLGPGQMILIDTEAGKVLRNDELKRTVAANAPYRRWLEEHRIPLRVAPEVEEPVAVPADADAKTRLALTKTPPDVVAQQQAFGYTAEDLRLVITPMAGEKKEPTWSMGDDAPLAVLSEISRPVTTYFRQRFAQVTNPAIDSLRERRVMALDTFLGRKGNILKRSPRHARRAHLPSFLLTTNEYDALLQSDDLRVAKLDTTFAVAKGSGAMARRLDDLCAEAEQAIRDGAEVIILSDRAVDEAYAFVPSPLVVGAIHAHLVQCGLRMRADLVCDAGDVWDVHQFAVLIGYSAAAIYPRMALDAASRLSGSRGFESLSTSTLRANYLAMVEYGFLKIMAKMGISTVSGYRGAQIFETLGLADEVIERCFPGTPARLGALGFVDLESDLLARHAEAYGAPAAKLPDPGMIKFKRDGETHAFAPQIVTAIQDAVRNNDTAAYKRFLESVKDQPYTAVRDLVDVAPLGDPVPLDDVEPISAIVQRFVVTAMSLGALSPEAHSTLSIGMNRLGARSNSGEGGEDPEWYRATDGDIPHSKVKQIASGRFGVTTEYLSMAEEIEIKVAQGAKPGEGGQLPGFKVTAFVARMRHAVEGLPLISPPPHHDIYSIEDLAQLIFDLRQVNPRAKVGVKLVAEAGVGTVAAGVAKARADFVLVSGHSGGTGAAALASIKHAGVPWELGLAETQQTLVKSGLRSRVRLRTDGGIKTPKDVIVGALLGADEFGFGTSVLIAIGCDMARQCHLNTCPTGIATQRADLRAKFEGRPEHVVAYFEHLCESIREELAALGARSLDELIGRSDLLVDRPREGRAARVDITPLLAAAAPDDQRRKTVDIDHTAEDGLSDRLWHLMEDRIGSGSAVTLTSDIHTSDRTVGARIAGHLAMRKHRGEPSAPVTLWFRGSAGQSFGAFTVDGMSVLLEGEANDYVGKGMNGGEIAIYPDRAAGYSGVQAIAGNTILYGATGGQLFVAGSVGERFCVRNSGATAVVEGVGDHGCEYMTGGRVLVIGETGSNFGAGMTNGRAWVLDADGRLDARVNTDSVSVRTMQDGDEDEVRTLLEQHVMATHSSRAKSLLADWERARTLIKAVVPTALMELELIRSDDAAAD